MCAHAHTNFQEKLCPACHAALRRNRAAPAPHTASHTTFRDPTRSDLLWKQGFTHFLPFKLSHCPMPATQSATCELSHVMTELLTGEFPLDYPTTWLSYSLVSDLFITLDWATQWWVTSWLLYHFTELVHCELPLDCSTTWLSYSMVSWLH